MRRSLNGAKTGHAGTLDPFATGLLLVLVGRATKAQRHLMALPKSYETVAQLGAISSTGDTEGEITVTGRLPPDPAAAADRRAAPAPAGALGREGRRRARLRARPARRAVRDARADRHRRALRADSGASGDAEHPGLQRAGFEIDCGSGTYVRSLIADLGDAYCLELRRTAIGPFKVRTPSRYRRAARAGAIRPLIALEQALAMLPGVRAD